MKATKEDLQNLDRLKKRSDFLLVNAHSAKAGGKWVSKGIIVLAAPNEKNVRRVGVTVTKKLEKSSVRRNRMKRRLRAAAADALCHNVRNGMDFVLIARADCATLPYADLVRDLKWCMKKMGHADQ